jgi:heme exporter protein D
MIWNSADEFFHMGGYGLYVWGSFLVIAAFMVIEVLLLRLRRRHALDQLARARELESLGDADAEFNGKGDAMEGGRS